MICPWLSQVSYLLLKLYCIFMFWWKFHVWKVKLQTSDVSGKCLIISRCYCFTADYSSAKNKIGVHIVITYPEKICNWQFINVNCNSQFAVCNLKLAICIANLQLSTCNGNLQLEICNIQFAIENLQFGIINWQFVICNW